MKIMTIIRSLLLTAGIFSLLFTEFLHPAFHNLNERPELIKQYSGNPCYAARSDASLEHSRHVCPVCSNVPFVCFLGGASVPAWRNYQAIRELSPRKYVSAGIIFYSLARAPPSLFS